MNQNYRKVSHEAIKFMSRAIRMAQKGLGRTSPNPMVGAVVVKNGKIDIMKAFLYHVLNRLIIDEYRKHKTVSLDSIMENGLTKKVTTRKTSTIFWIQRKPCS